MRQLFLDTETTGLRVEEGNRLIEVACVEYVSREPTGRTYHQYINPQREVEPDAYKVHGLDLDFLSDYPLFGDVAESLLDFVRDTEVVIHNAEFDVGFLNAELRMLNQRRDTQLPMIDQLCRIEDSLMLARSLYQGSVNLDSLCTRFNIDKSERGYHGALVDASLLARVYIAMTSTQGKLELALERNQVRSSGDLKTDHLKVVRATAEELAAHRNYMQQLENTRQA